MNAACREVSGPLKWASAPLSRPPENRCIFKPPLLKHFHGAAGTKEALKESVEASLRSGARYYLAFAYRIFGEVTRITDPDQSFNYFEKCIALDKEIKAENELALAYAGYGRLYKQQGNAEKAKEYLDKALKILD
ncbi:MAG: tetratricopeptide repeat protein, partial [Desulfobacterales bacterium]